MPLSIKSVHRSCAILCILPQIINKVTNTGNTHCSFPFIFIGSWYGAIVYPYRVPNDPAVDICSVEQLSSLRHPSPQMFSAASFQLKGWFCCVLSVVVLCLHRLPIALLLKL